MVLEHVLSSASDIYCKNDKNRILHPLKNAHKDDTVWQKGYQAVKHNRKDALSSANIENLLKALSTLYLLNVYYRDESFYQTSLTRGNTDFNVSFGSNIFSIKMSNRPYTNQVNRENSSGADQDNVDSVYLLCFPMISLQRV